MNKLKFLFPSLLFLVACALFSSCEKELEKDEKLIIRMYTAPLATTELGYLKTLDSKQLSASELAEQKTRTADLTKLVDIIQSNDAAYGAVLEARYGGIPPGPLPCPIVSGCLDFSVNIRNVELGVYSDDIQNTTATILSDDQKIFATGDLKTPYQLLFKTARFSFTVKDKNLAAKPLTLIINTSVYYNKGLQNTQLTVPLPANTFVVE